MGRAREYRWFAARCLEIARATADTQTKAAMLQMAQVWSRLAEDIKASEQEGSEDAAARGIDLGPSIEGIDRRTWSPGDLIAGITSSSADLAYDKPVSPLRSASAAAGNDTSADFLQNRLMRLSVGFSGQMAAPARAFPIFIGRFYQATIRALTGAHIPVASRHAHRGTFRPTRSPKPAKHRPILMRAMICAMMTGKCGAPAPDRFRPNVGGETMRLLIAGLALVIAACGGDDGQCTSPTGTGKPDERNCQSRRPACGKRGHRVALRMIQRSKPTTRPTTRRSKTCRTSNTTPGGVYAKRGDGQPRRRLRPSGTAGRAIGQLAVKPDHAEIDAPTLADQAGILGDRVEDFVPRAVVDHRRSAAEAARNILCGPRQYGGLAGYSRCRRSAAANSRTAPPWCGNR